MVAHNRFQGIDSAPMYEDDGTGWMASRFAPLSLAEVDGLRGMAVRAGVRGAALAIFLVLLMHTDCLGFASGRFKRLAEDAAVEPATARQAIYTLRDKGQLRIARKGAGRRRPVWHIAGLRGWTP